MKVLLPINDDQFDAGIGKFIRMVSNAISVDDLVKVLPYHSILAEHARFRNETVLASAMIDHYWQKREYLRVSKEQIVALL